jgi:phosphoglucomutase
MSDLHKTIQQAVDDGSLLQSSAANMLQLLGSGDNPIYRSSVAELLSAQAWAELNDRFFKTLAFGTGGIRGRSIGRVVTGAEQGAYNAACCPQYPCVGTNAMNFYNVSKATQALVTYMKAHLAKSAVSERASLCIAHDTRYFSRQFAELAAITHHMTMATRPTSRTARSSSNPTPPALSNVLMKLPAKPTKPFLRPNKAK